jgi:hypothetical protein
MRSCVLCLPSTVQIFTGNSVVHFYTIPNLVVQIYVAGEKLFFFIQLYLICVAVKYVCSKIRDQQLRQIRI